MQGGVAGLGGLGENREGEVGGGRVAWPPPRPSSPTHLLVLMTLIAHLGTVATGAQQGGGQVKLASPCYVNGNGC